MWLSQKESAKGWAKINHWVHKPHPDNHHCFAPSSESCNTGRAHLGRWPTLRGVVRTHPRVCSPVRSAGAAWGGQPRSHVWWCVLVASGASPSTCLSSSKRPPRASLPDSDCPKGAMPGLGSHTASRLQDSASQSPPQASPDSRGGKNSKAKLSVWHREVLGGTVNIIIHSRVERHIINACVHTLSVSPLNSKAFEELKILCTFVPPGATPIVLLVQWVLNKFA